MKSIRLSLYGAGVLNVASGSMDGVSHSTHCRDACACVLPAFLGRESIAFIKAQIFINFKTRQPLP